MKTKQSFLIIIYGALIVDAAFNWNNTSTQRNNCSGTQFKCKNGQCIKGENLCDGKPDCSDQSDETQVECSRPDIRCHRYAFRCAYGACVDGDAVCNGVKDCVDSSDELLSRCSDVLVLNRPSGSDSGCAQDQFRCGDGQCIDGTKICDGNVDCKDRSDESYANCASFTCPGLSFKCKYGGCIDGDLKCNGIQNCIDGSDEEHKLCAETTTSSSIWRPTTTTRRPYQNNQRTTYSYTTKRPATQSSILSVKTPCRVPSQPENGNWKLHNSQCRGNRNCNIDPSIDYLDPGTYLVYSCDDGFKIDGSKDVFCGPQGQWANIPKCTEIRCESLNSPSTQASCTLNNNWISCDSSVPIHTVAKLACRNSYRQDATVLSTQRDTVKCNKSGEWEPQPIRCIPVCGVTTRKDRPLIVNGTAAKISDFPWHATLYYKRDNKIEFICGATIVQADLLVTAAHCVYNEGRRMVDDASKFYIATGNVFRDYNSPHHNERYVKKVKVKNIYVHCNYLGLEGNYARDIAILQIDRPFTFSALLMPICLDTTGSNDQIALSEGNLGRVAGFGRTAKGSSSFILQTISVPYVPISKCKATAAESEKFITIDKFCAGYDNGTSVCDGDSGGGLVFNTSGLWYLQGIVSAGVGANVLGGARICDSFAYSLYTRVSFHLEWIQDIMLNIETHKIVPSCPT